MGRDSVALSPISGPLYRGPDDWVLDIWFRGLKTGRILHRRHAGKPWADPDVVEFAARGTYKIFDPSRIVDLKIRRRREADAEAGKVVMYGNGVMSR